MPATQSNPRDPWHNYGAKYLKTGVSRGTTTASGVFTVNTLFPRQVEYADAQDEATHLRNSITGGGVQNTMSTFYFFQMLTPSGATARFRVRKFAASGDMNASFTLASATTGIVARWRAQGF